MIKLLILNYSIIYFSIKYLRVKEKKEIIAYGNYKNVYLSYIINNLNVGGIYYNSLDVRYILF